MIILGVDPGTDRVGYGVIEKNGASLGFITADLLCWGAKDVSRLAAIKHGIDVLIEEYHPDIVAVEKIYFVKNQKTGIRVAQARGVILLSAEERNVVVRELDPVTIKAGVTGYGKADKKAVAKMVRLLLKEELRVIDDVTDALAAAIVAASNEFESR